MACGGKSLLNEAGEGNLVGGEEASDGSFLGLAEAFLLGMRESLELLYGDGLEALSEGVVSVDVLLESCLHFDL